MSLYNMCKNRSRKFGVFEDQADYLPGKGMEVRPPAVAKCSI